jgi:hypothetical protein
MQLLGVHGEVKLWSGHEHQPRVKSLSKIAYLPPPLPLSVAGWLVSGSAILCYLVPEKVLLLPNNFNIVCSRDVSPPS